MDDPLVILAVMAVCAFVALVLFFRVLRWLVHRELRRMFTQLRESKFVMVRRDGKGRFCK